LALMVALLAAFALRLTALTLQDIWWDEARNIDVALRPLLEVAVAPELDIQPPFYYWLQHFWLSFAGVSMGDAPQSIAFFSRFLSVWFGVASIALLFPFAHGLARRTHSAEKSSFAGIFAVIVGVLSPFWLAESQEARMYTLGFALLGAAAYCLLRFLTDAPERVFRLVAFTLLSTLALITHYNAVFILAAWYGWWGVWSLLQPDRWRRLLAVVLCGCATAILLLPMLPIALRQIPTYANPNLTVPTVAEYLSQNWQGFLAGYAFDPAALAGRAVGWLWLTLLLFVVGLILLAINNSRFTIYHSSFAIDFSFLLVWLLGGLTLYYIAVLDRGAFNIRYSSFVTPALYALLGAGLAAFGARWQLGGVVALAIVAVGMTSFVRADLYEPRFGREDIAGVTEWLRANARPDDLILVDQKYPFGFYYKRFVVDPQATPEGPEAAPARYLFVDINTLDQRLNEWAGAARRVFWVQWFESDTDPRHAVGYLLGQAGQHVGEEWRQGYSIDWWELSPPNGFALAPNMAPLTVAVASAVQTVAASWPQEVIAPGSPVPVAIRWQAAPGGAVDRPLKARVALYDETGNRLAQADERLLNDRHLAPAEWAAEEQPINVYLLETSAELAEGDYELRLLVYDAETLEPLTMVDAADTPAGIEAPMGRVKVER
jgi:hypothetical protein